jgi:hypothetical protein
MVIYVILKPKINKVNLSNFLTFHNAELLKFAMENMLNFFVNLVPYHEMKDFTNLRRSALYFRTN